MLVNKSQKKAFFQHNESTLNVPINRSSSVFYFLESNAVST